MPSLETWVERSTGQHIIRMEPLQPGAGRRRYLRVTLVDGSSRVVMHAVPEDPAILPPALRAPRRTIDFVAVTRLLEHHGIPVPEIYAVETAQRWVLLEDLGSVHVGDLSGTALLDRLREAAALLARVHSIPRSEELPFGREFDAEWVSFEMEYFVGSQGGVSRDPELAAAVDALVVAVARLPRVLCLRDYHCQNLMVDREGRLRIIDYQDALLAPPELDLAAFLYDSYLDLDPSTRDELLGQYESTRGVSVSRGSLALLIAQRKCKDVARFRELVRRGDNRFAKARVCALRAALKAVTELPGALRSHRPALERALEAPR